MNAFDRYVFRQLLVGVILVTAGLTGVLWLSQSLRFVDFIVNRGLDIVTFFHLVMLLLPNFMLVILPIAVFAAVCFTYAKLISDREMIVMGASGVSPFGLAKPALLLAVLVSLITYTLNMTVLPASYRMFRELQWDLRYNYAHVLLEEGAFTDAGVGITVYVRERSPDGQLRGILVHDARNDEDPSTLWLSMAVPGSFCSMAAGRRSIPTTTAFRCCISSATCSTSNRRAAAVSIATASRKSERSGSCSRFARTRRLNPVTTVSSWWRGTVA